MSKKQEIKNFINSCNFIPSKKMGQNFLYNNFYQKKIVDSSCIDNSCDVIEIGPGLGAITNELVKKANRVVAIELDKRLFEYLKNKINVENLILINNDILKIDLNEIIKKYNLQNVKVVANLPYSISSKIILELLKVDEINEIYILVQKEMAERINAKVNTKEYNSFTVLVSIYAKIKSLFDIPPENFIPPPKVNSTFIKLTRIKNHDFDFIDISNWLKLCFNQKRKTLVNNLNQKYDKKLILEKLSTLKISDNIRSEALNQETLIKLYDEFKN